MIKTEKILHLKSCRGRKVRVVREHYLRARVPCYSALCQADCANGKGSKQRLNTAFYSVYSELHRGSNHSSERPHTIIQESTTEIILLNQPVYILNCFMLGCTLFSLWIHLLMIFFICEWRKIVRNVHHSYPELKVTSSRCSTRSTKFSLL